MDALAENGHIIHYGIIMYISIEVSTSVFTCCLVGILVFFYLTATRRLYARSQYNRELAGLQTQCDVKMA